MTHGIDTDFLVAAEIRDHPFHREADALLQSLLADGHDLALVPQTLAEFIHIVTDGRRMPQPLTMTEAISRADHWWQAAEVVRVFPDGQTVVHFLSWLTRHQLGRKRLLDTMLAAAFHNAGVRRIVTNNKRDFQLLGFFKLWDFRPPRTSAGGRCACAFTCAPARNGRRRESIRASRRQEERLPTQRSPSLPEQNSGRGEQPSAMAPKPKKAD